MAITINGSANTIAGVAAGGINDNVVDNGTMADNAIDSAEITAGAVDLAHLSASGTASSSTYLRGDNSWAAVPASGIQEATQFHMTTTFQGDASTITNWQETTVGAANSLKTANSAGGVTESSGKFSLPSTGFWYVEFGAQSRGIDMSRYEQYYIETTENNETSWQTVAFNQQFINDNGTDDMHYVNVFTSCILDVTSISGGTTTKVKFGIDHENNATYTIGHANCNCTYALFIRLADT